MRQPQAQTRPTPCRSTTKYQGPRGDACGGNGRSSSAGSTNRTPCCAPAGLRCGLYRSSPSHPSSGRSSSTSREPAATRPEHHLASKMPPKLSSPEPHLADNRPSGDSHPCARSSLQSTRPSPTAHRPLASAMLTRQLAPLSRDELVLNTGQLIEGEPAACYAATCEKQHPIRSERLKRVMHSQARKPRSTS